MKRDINKYIKDHVMAFGAYSLLAVMGIYLGEANHTSLFIMIFYALTLAVHALIAMIGLSKFPNTKTVILKGVLLILGIILIGFSLCMSPIIIIDNL